MPGQQRVQGQGRAAQVVAAPHVLQGNPGIPGFKEVQAGFLEMS